MTNTSKQKLFNIMVAPSFCSAIFIVCCILESGCSIQSDLEISTLDYHKHKAIYNTSILESLYEGRKACAIEDLEFSIDVAILRAPDLLTEMKNREQGQIIRFLKTIRAFRKIHPRTLSEHLDIETKKRGKEIAYKSEEILTTIDLQALSDKKHERGCGVPQGCLPMLPPLEVMTALDNMLILTFLYGDKHDLAIESLETDIDFAVLASWQQYNDNVARKESKMEMRFLKKIKEFRQSYPRTCPDQYVGDLREDMCNMVSNVQEILEGLNYLNDSRRQ